ncbi:hypothetical protein SYNPS1DRAFT_29399, partial [Syncephalis pseudoplumigaleata]
MLPPTSSKPLDSTLGAAGVVVREMAKPPDVTIRFSSSGEVSYKPDIVASGTSHSKPATPPIAKPAPTAPQPQAHTPDRTLLASIPPESAYILDQKLEAHARPATKEELRFCASMTGLPETTVDAYLRYRLAHRKSNGRRMPPPPAVVVVDEPIDVDHDGSHVRATGRPQRAAARIQSYAHLEAGHSSDDDDDEDGDDDADAAADEDEDEEVDMSSNHRRASYGTTEAATPTRKAARPARMTKQPQELGYVHGDLSKVVPRTLQGPVFWQTIQCRRQPFNRFERCVSCVTRDSGCRFVRVRVFALCPNAVGKKRTNIVSSDLIYGPFFCSAVDEESEGRLMPWSRQDVPRTHDSAMMASTEHDTHARARYPFGSPEQFILGRVAPTVRRLVDRELTFAEHAPCYRREPLHLQRQLCDACLTNIFNGFWMCSICGLEICMDCYDEWDTGRDRERVQQCTYGRQHGRQHMVRMCSYGLGELRWMKETLAQQSLPPPLPPSALPLSDDGSFEAVGHFRPYQKLHITSDNDQLDRFQACWQRGEACFVPNLLDRFTRELWTPSWFIEHHGHEVTEMIDCRTGDALVDMTVGRFFRGFSDIT